MATRAGGIRGRDIIYDGDVKGESKMCGRGKMVHLQPTIISMSSPLRESGPCNGDESVGLEGPIDKEDVEDSPSVVVGGPIKYGRNCAGKSELLVVVDDDCDD